MWLAISQWTLVVSFWKRWSTGSFFMTTWWLIPLSKWLITPIISGLTLLIPFITGVITHLLSGMSHQVVRSNTRQSKECLVLSWRELCRDMSQHVATLITNWAYQMAINLKEWTTEIWAYHGLPSGNLSHNYWKWPSRNSRFTKLKDGDFP